jgi:hypothetical protein
MPRLFAPAVIVTLVLAACSGASARGSQPADVSATSPSLARPSVQLTISGGPAAGSYSSEAASGLDLCTRTADGGWRLQFSGTGTTIDLLVGGHAAEPGRASDVFLEIDADGGYLLIDPAGFHSTNGDPKGRSEVAVAISSAEHATTLAVAGKTPYKSPEGDGGYTDLALTVVCPT